MARYLDVGVRNFGCNTDLEAALDNVHYILHILGKVVHSSKDMYDTGFPLPEQVALKFIEQCEVAVRVCAKNPVPVAAAHGKTDEIVLDDFLSLRVGKEVCAKERRAGFD